MIENRQRDWRMQK